LQRFHRKRNIQGGRDECDRCGLHHSAHSRSAASTPPALRPRPRYYHLDDDASLLSPHDLLPPPVAADLNGDGRTEVVAVTHTGQLQVLGPRRPGHERQGFAAALLLAEAALVPMGPNMAHTGARAHPRLRRSPS